METFHQIAKPTDRLSSLISKKLSSILNLNRSMKISIRLELKFHLKTDKMIINLLLLYYNLLTGLKQFQIFKK